MNSKYYLTTFLLFYYFSLIKSFDVFETFKINENSVGKWVVIRQTEGCHETCGFKFGSIFQSELIKGSTKEIKFKMSQFAQGNVGNPQISEDGSKCSFTAKNGETQQQITVQKEFSCTQIDDLYFSCKGLGEESLNKLSIVIGQENDMKLINFEYKQQQMDENGIYKSQFCYLEGFKLYKDDDAKDILGTYKVIDSQCDICKYQVGSDLFIDYKDNQKNRVQIKGIIDGQQRICKDIHKNEVDCYYHQEDTKRYLYACFNLDFSKSQLFARLQITKENNNFSQIEINYLVGLKNRACKVKAKRNQKQEKEIDSGSQKEVVTDSNDQQQFQNKQVKSDSIKKMLRSTLILLIIFATLMG